MDRRLIGIAWSWFTLGVTFWLLMGPYAAEPGLTMLGADVLGLIFGAAVAATLSRRLPEIGLLPIGALGMGLFCWRLSAVGTGPEWLNVFLLGGFSGAFAVPLSLDSQSVTLRRVISAFSFLAALVFCSGILVKAASSERQLFSILAITHFVFGGVLFLWLSDRCLRLLTQFLAGAFYRIHVSGIEHIPLQGPAVLVCNHVSFVDWFIIWAAVPRPPRYIMDYIYAKSRPVQAFLKLGRVILIASYRQNPELLKAAFRQAANELRAGHLLCIFPEGVITWDGKLGVFKTGVEKIVRENQVPVVPMALVGIWGSFFSRKDAKGPFWKRGRLSLRAKIELRIGPAVPAEQVSVEHLSERVQQLIAG